MELLMEILNLVYEAKIPNVEGLKGLCKIFSLLPDEKKNKLDVYLIDQLPLVEILAEMFFDTYVKIDDRGYEEYFEYNDYVDFNGIRAVFHPYFDDEPEAAEFFKKQIEAWNKIIGE